MADRRADALARLVAPMRVKPGSRVVLAKNYDPGFKADWLRKSDGEEYRQTGIQLLAEYQNRLAAQDTFALLIVLQALDAAGKDGMVRHVMSGVNPQGVTVHSFKVPSQEELNHDFLWRYAQRLPARGEIAIFNRSHYEEVLVVRVHPELLLRQRLPCASMKGDVWKRRYREINGWERYLVDNGVRILKLFLNVSREEQRLRFLKRIDDPDKNWKFSAADLAERERWDDYQDAYSEMLTHTSTEWAPWHVIPADHKWFARIVVGALIGQTLLEIDPHYPSVEPGMREELAQAREKLEGEAANGARATRR
jgi:PPK2 family polyphosphate:nucleotide phosphotransferase